MCLTNIGNIWYNKITNKYTIEWCGFYKWFAYMGYIYMETKQVFRYKWFIDERCNEKISINIWNKIIYLLFFSNIFPIFVYLIESKILFGKHSSTQNSNRHTTAYFQHKGFYAGSYYFVSAEWIFCKTVLYTGII